MKPHAAIIAEYRGYRRACWHGIVGSVVLAASTLFADPQAWPPAVFGMAVFGGGGLFILWKLRSVKSHGRELE